MVSRYYAIHDCTWLGHYITCMAIHVCTYMDIYTAILPYVHIHVRRYMDIQYLQLVSTAHVDTDE